LVVGFSAFLGRSPSWDAHLLGTLTFLGRSPSWDAHLLGTLTFLARHRSARLRRSCELGICETEEWHAPQHAHVTLQESIQIATCEITVRLATGSLAEGQ